LILIYGISQREASLYRGVHKKRGIINFQNMNKYKGLYRIPSARHPYWDYGNNAYYFVTINTAHGYHYFGKVRNGNMHLNQIGEFAHECWLDIPKHYPFVNLYNHIIMPNHTHGILQIAKPEKSQFSNSEIDKDSRQKDSASIFTPFFSSRPLNKFGPQSKNLAAIIRGYKTGVTIKARKINPRFKWHPRFHDHIIRDGRAFHNIQNYILNNPANWKKDKFYKK